MDSQPKLYQELAKWWPLVSDPEPYKEEAEFARGILKERKRQPVKTALELGCGGGNNASHLKKWMQMTLTDLSAGMVQVSKSLNPECEHHVADMRTLRLGTIYDAVFIHDALDYMTSLKDLRSAMVTAHVHLRTGGTAVLVPDYFKETFKPSTKHGGHDKGKRGLRYLEWTLDEDPKDNRYELHYAFMLREENGSMHVELDRHACGLFPRREWIKTMKSVGFEVETKPDDYRREWLIGTKTTGGRRQP
jgi:SAM-dependent methyltransferase